MQLIIASVMFTVETTSSNVKKQHFLSAHSVFMCFVWITEQTATISLYSIN